MYVDMVSSRAIGIVSNCNGALIVGIDDVLVFDAVSVGIFPQRYTED
jgi:hypothetical protein